ncbi:hypothetical protein SAMN05192553_108136 [Cyclobacterium xiamenense]|jgi:hypothetical protein|uniref:Uncharacterized protein n=1 Tax=Cyclobacterium xiamenense TaxID=1297121 RepID=A0A1H7B3X8_9BACT|nr:hypothetical protein [Cyclobacterium xiamenense]SEJ69122.1 hypothetical protein SAMN05192553_108136 [Cyclobacterium xiamenense]
MINSTTKTLELGDVTYVKRVSIGNINPNSPLNEEQQERQMALLNKCLNEYPKGKIIGKDISVGVFQIGDHQITLQRTTYHVGFLRKPVWLEDNT